MSRSKWKGPFIDINNINELKEKRQENKLISMGRNSEITPLLVGFSYNVHNGKTYSEVSVTENMIGHKFGEFSFTRAKYIFKKKKLKKKTK